MKTRKYGKSPIKKQIKRYNYRRKDGRLIRVPPHRRTYYISRVKLEAIKSKTIRKVQIIEKDWTHLSYDYRNLIGITDGQVEKFIELHAFNLEEKENLREYISKIRCYNKDDFGKLSIQMQKEFEKIMEQYKVADFDDNTVYITSPRGGFEVLSIYSYANNLSKKNLPVDFYKEGGFMASTSLPYGYTIKDINDIVYIDDICMSGEQQNRAYYELDEMIRKLEIPSKERPRLHYMALVGCKEQIEIDEKGKRSITYYKEKQPWDSVILGEEHSFSYNENTKKYNDISAVMFPYGVPDGSRHANARQLYNYCKKEGN